MRKNLKRTIVPNAAFVENGSHLNQNNIGLNTRLLASSVFRSQEWQDGLRNNPLEREDFVVVGWLGEGRTMRQAIREFNFDVAQATAILARLLKTNSVEPLRPVTLENIADSETGDLNPMMQRYSTTGGQKHAAANFAQAASRAYNPDPGFVQDAFISTSFRPNTVSPEIEVEPKPAPKRSIFDPIKKIGDEVRASMEARLRVRTLRKEHSVPEPEREESPSARNSNTRPADPRSTNTNMRPADPRSTN